MDDLIAFRNRLSDRLLNESRRIADFIDRRVYWLLAVWAILSLGGGLLRAGVFFHRFPGLASDARIPQLLAPSILIAAAPWAAHFLVVRAYPKISHAALSAPRAAPQGKWRALRSDLPQDRAACGFEGFLVSLAVGMLLSMVMRLATYYLAMPAMPPGAPRWATAAFRIMTYDVAFLSFMYMICFTMVQRAVRLFPRMLIITWCYDLFMQFAIAKTIVSAGPVPEIVAGPFTTLLMDNVYKILISVTIWLPYLILSTRINATFRGRIRVRHGKFAPDDGFSIHGARAGQLSPRQSGHRQGFALQPGGGMSS